MTAHHTHHSTSEENQSCRCAEDDNCGCTFPENVETVISDGDITETQESFKIKTEERFIEKDTICYCSPKNCDCKIEYKESDY